MRIPIALVLVAVLSACQIARPVPEDTPGPAPQVAMDLRAEYAALAAKGGTAYAINAAQSQVQIYIFRGGRAAKLGHNHVISAPNVEGYVYLPSDDATAARFDVRVPVAELVVDDPKLRAATGGAFAGERSADDIEGTRRNMLGERGLDAARYPSVHLKSAAIAGDWPVLVAEVDVTVRNVTKRQLALLRVDRGEGLKVKGELVLRQSDFGITPFALFGGVLSVQDAVAIDFELNATPQSR